ncbi:MAG: hypothetical protein WC863_00860 [Patescibacteria group bacterium]
MKKIISFWLMISAVVAIINLAPARAESLEKISSPDQIKYYQKIERRGNVLYGVKVKMEKLELKDAAPLSSKVSLEKISSPDQIKYYQKVERRGNVLYGVKVKSEKLESEKNSDSSVSSPTQNEPTTAVTTSQIETPTTANPGSASVSAGTLEKIAEPASIPLYEKIKKIGASLWGVKKANVKTTPAIKIPSSSTIQNNVSTVKVVRAEISGCVATVIDTKDKALIEKESAFSSELISLISERSVCQQAAVKSLDNQKKNLDVCVQDFKKGRDQLQESAKLGRKAIQDVYKNSLKACSKSVLATSTKSIEAETVMIEDGSED